MRARLVRWLTYGAAVSLLAAGLAMFSVAEAGATGGPAACGVYFGSGSVSDQSSLSFGLDCTSVPSGVNYFIVDFFPLDGHLYEGVMQFCGSYAPGGVPDCPDGVGSGSPSSVAEVKAAFGGYSGSCGLPTTYVIAAWTGCSVPLGHSGGSLFTDANGNHWATGPLIDFTACASYCWGYSSAAGSTYGSGTGPVAYSSYSCSYVPASGEAGVCSVIGSVLVTGYDGSTTYETAPCTLQSVAGPAYVTGGIDSVIAPGQDYSWVVQYSTATELAVVPDWSLADSSSITEASYSDGSTTVDGKTFSDSFFPLQPLTSPTTVHIDLSSLSKLDIIRGLDMWCYSGSSGWVDWGDLGADSAASVGGVGTDPNGFPIVSGGPGPTSPVDDGGAFSLSGCLGGSGLGLDPSSWVPALTSDFVCGVRWLFVPTPATVSGLMNQFGLSSSAPSVGTSSASQWLGSGAYLLAEGPYTSMQAIQTDEQSGGCSLLDGSGYAIGSHHFTVCGALASVSSTSAANSAWSVIKPVIAAAFLVMFFLALIAMLRKLLGSNT